VMPTFRKELNDLRQDDIRRSSDAAIRGRSGAREPIVVRLSWGLARWLHGIARRLETTAPLAREHDLAVPESRLADSPRRR
jgi:hypothetical protein